MAWALEKALNAHRYTVNIATDGEIGLELATSLDYDLILLDLLIPKLDGITLCRQLRSKGFQKPILLLTAKDSNLDIVKVVTNLTAARRAITQTPPDVILLDLSFPDPSADGLTLLRELVEQFPSIPVLAFTGRDNLADRVAVSRLGGRGFLHKPVEPPQVFQAITQVLSPTLTTEAKVMVVDDDPAALAMLRHLLQPWGFQVTCLENPQQFWEVLTATAPHLLILDLEMPTFSGIDLCQVVRQDPQWGDLPILVVTAHTNAESLQRVFAAGADDFIGKPVVGPELVTRVTSRIERVRFRQQLEDIHRRAGKPS